MRFVEFLKTTVLLSAGAATALATVTVLAIAGSQMSVSSQERLIAAALGWWILAALIGLRLGRRAETNPPIARLLAGARASTALPEHHPGADPPQPPLAAAPVHADRRRPRLPRPPDPRHRRRLRDHLGARLAPPARRRRRHRGARRRRLLRQAHLSVAADRAPPHARLQGPAPRAHQRLRHLMSHRRRRVASPGRRAADAGARRAQMPAPRAHGSRMTGAGHARDGGRAVRSTS